MGATARAYLGAEHRVSGADDDVLRIHCGEQLADRSYAFVGVDSTVLRPDRGRSSDPRPDGPCMSRTRSATPDGRRKDFELAALNREMRDALRKHRLGHRSRFSFDPGFTVPVMRVDENVAEKLGRWQERALVRNLYDLAALSTSIDDPQLVTRMWVLKSHTGMTSGSRRGRGGPAASIDELTADKPSTPFVLGDLVLPADPPDTAKRRLIEANLATSLLPIR